MKKFYEIYKDNDIVTPLVTQISWTNHLLIMSGCKTDGEREFYIRLCIKENYSKRQLERQLDSGLDLCQYLGHKKLNFSPRKSGQKTVRTFLIYSQMTVELFTSFMV